MTVSDLPVTIGPYRNRIIGLRVVPVGELLDNPRNWRQHPPAQAAGLDAVMRQVGVIDVIRYNEPTDRIWDGHLRKRLWGRDPETPVVVLVTDLDEDEEAVALATFDALTGMARADAAALLRAARDSEIVEDDTALGDLLREVGRTHDVDIDATDEPADDAGAQVDRAAELRETWGTARGQLWLIPSQTVPGKHHRLLCGDSTSPDDVTRLMDGARATLFATDPPYLVDYDGTNHPSKWGEEAPAKNKDRSEEHHDWDRAEQSEGLYDGFVKVAVEVAITENAAWYCWHACWHQAMLETVWKRYGAFVHQQIIWVKDRPALTRSWYMWQHEPCFFGWVKGQKPFRAADDHPASVWQIPTIAPGTRTAHLTAKPVELFAIPMRQHTRPGEVCYEPFAGSGSQFVAGEQTGRLVYGLELQPEFVAVILQRLADMGLEPQLVEADDESEDA